MIELLHGQGSTKWYKEQTRLLQKKREDAKLQFVISGLSNGHFRRSIERLAEAFQMAGVSAKEMADAMRSIFQTLNKLNERKIMMNIVRKRVSERNHFVVMKFFRMAQRNGFENVNIEIMNPKQKGKGDP